MDAMSAILEKLRHPFWIDFVSFMVPIRSMNFKLIGASVLQIKDGCHGGHIGKAATHIFNRILFLHSPNPPYEFQIDWCKCSPVIELKPVQDGCHGGHIGKVTTPIFNRFLLLDKFNALCEFQIDQCERSYVIGRKQIQDGCHGGHIWKIATPIFNWLKNWVSLKRSL